MLLTNIKEESIMKRIEQVVSVLMEENSVFKEDFNYEEMVKLLVNLVQENFTFEDFNNMSDKAL